MAEDQKQPPSFEPKRRRARPSADGARTVGSRDGALNSPANSPRPNNAASASAGRASAASRRPRLRDSGGNSFNNAGSRGDVRTGQDGGTPPPSYQPASRSTTSSRPSTSSAAATARSAQQQRPQVHVRGGSASRQPAQEESRPARSGRSNDSSRPPGTSRSVSPSRSGDSDRPSGRRRRRRKWPWVLGVFAIILLLVIGWPLYLLHYGNSKMEHVSALSGRADTPGSTYLIVGSDRREENAINDGTEGQRSDTIMLLQVPESGSPALVSLPRDAYVTIPGYGDGKLNASYSQGGPELLVATVENLTGMTVDHYIEISMGGVQQLVDAVGGVNLCYDYDVSDADSQLEWTAGCHDADGATALAFSRMRKADPLGDIGRTMRQRQVVGKVVDKAVSRDTLFSPSRQKNLVGAVAENLTTDPDTSMLSLVRAGMSLRTVMGEGGLIGAPPIASLDYRVGGQSVVLLDQELTDPFFEKMKNGTLTAEDFYQASY